MNTLLLIIYNKVRERVFFSLASVQAEKQNNYIPLFFALLQGTVLLGRNGIYFHIPFPFRLH